MSKKLAGQALEKPPILLSRLLVDPSTVIGVQRNPINEIVDPEILPNLAPNQEDLPLASLYNVGFLNKGSEIPYLHPLPFNFTLTSLDPRTYKTFF